MGRGLGWRRLGRSRAPVGRRRRTGGQSVEGGQMGIGKAGFRMWMWIFPYDKPPDLCCTRNALHMNEVPSALVHILQQGQTSVTNPVLYT